MIRWQLVAYNRFKLVLGVKVGSICRSPEKHAQLCGVDAGELAG